MRRTAYKNKNTRVRRITRKAPLQEVTAMKLKAPKNIWLIIAPALLAALPLIYYTVKSVPINLLLQNIDSREVSGISITVIKDKYARTAALM